MNKLKLENKLYTDIDSQGFSIIKRQLGLFKALKDYDCRVTIKKKYLVIKTCE